MELFLKLPFFFALLLFIDSEAFDDNNIDDDGDGVSCKNSFVHLDLCSPPDFPLPHSEPAMRIGRRHDLPECQPDLEHTSCLLCTVACVRFLQPV